jgi:hypothetical protein
LKDKKIEAARKALLTSIYGRYLSILTTFRTPKGRTGVHQDMRPAFPIDTRLATGRLFTPVNPNHLPLPILFLDGILAGF